jgi:hypothetical protein
MNSKLRRFLSRLFSDQMPVIRKAGSRSARLITILNTGKMLRVIPAADIGVLKIDQKEQRFVVVGGADILCEFDSRDDAVAVLNRIHHLVSPSRWRWFWRVLVLWLAYILFVPSSTPVRPYASAAMSAVPPSLSTATMPGPSGGPAVASPQNDEPFGLPAGAIDARR